jgi:hypothetical protein
MHRTAGAKENILDAWDISCYVELTGWEGQQLLREIYWLRETAAAVINLLAERDSSCLEKFTG